MVGDVYQVNFWWSIGARTITSQLRLKEAIACTDAWPEDTLGIVVGTTIVPAMRLIQSHLCQYQWWYVRKIQGGPGTPREILTNLAGQVVSDAMPPNTHALFGLYAGTGETGRRGWFRVPGIAETLQNRGNVTVEYLENVNDLVNALKALLPAAPGKTGRWEPCIYRDGYSQHPAVNLVAPRPSIATRRTRRQRPGVEGD